MTYFSYGFDRKICNLSKYIVYLLAKIFQTESRVAPTKKKAIESKRKRTHIERNQKKKRVAVPIDRNQQNALSNMTTDD